MRWLSLLLVASLGCDDGATEEADAGPATAGPRLEAARLHVNRGFESLGFHVAGRAGTAGVVAILATFFDDADAPLGEPVRIPFDRLALDAGRFDGRASFQAFGVELVARAEVRVVDAEEGESAAIEAVPEAPGAAAAGDCDALRAVDECPPDALCTRRGCEASVAECPADWAVGRLSPGAVGVRDDTSGAPPLAAGTCGGGSSSHVYAFTARRAGEHLFELESDGHPDTLLFVRSACAASDVAAELGCNDDRTEGDLFHSAVVAPLEAGETVYVFVDGYSEEEATGGGYLLSGRHVTAPVIDGGAGFVNAPDRAIGVAVEGVDADRDVEVGWLSFLDSEGRDVEIAGPVDVAFTDIAWSEDRFAGRLAVEFLASFEGFEAISEVLVSVSDAAGLESDGVFFSLDPAPGLESGAGCDVVAGFGRCPADEGCANTGAADDAPRCQPPVEACPADWAVTDLHTLPDWRASGDTTGARNHGDLASCGGGGPNAVFRFVAPAPGAYVFTLDATGEADPVLFARTHCAFSQGAYELACNDDRGEGTLQSKIELDMAADAGVFLFIDGYAGASIGAFSLTGRAVER